MATVYTKGMVAKLPGGMVISQYRVDNTTTTKGDTIAAKDIGLSTIYSLTANALGSIAVTVGVGTFKAGKGDTNYATLRSFVAGSGTAYSSVNLGTTQILAIGI